MLKAKIPLYFWRKQRPELESATSGLLEQHRLYDNTLATLYFRLKDPFLKAPQTETYWNSMGTLSFPRPRSRWNLHLQLSRRNGRLPVTAEQPADRAGI